MPEETKSSTLRIPIDLHKKIKRIADRKRLSMAQAIIQAIDEYCAREGGK
jgi:predicted transcriptional regulator